MGSAGGGSVVFGDKPLTFLMFAAVSLVSASFWPGRGGTYGRAGGRTAGTVMC